MDATTAGIELTVVPWESWIAAALRAERSRTLAATARPRRRRPARSSRPVRGSLLWMLAVSIIGLWLLG
jgi:hypothetical protein